MAGIEGIASDAGEEFRCGVVFEEALASGNVVEREERRSG